MRFTKAHGLGNDFIIVLEQDAPEEWAPWSTRLCDRNKGIGADGVLIIGVDAANNLARMKLINADGTHGEISGNGVRCVAAWVFSRGLLPKAHTVLPPPGPRPVVVERTGPWQFEVDTNLGEPGLNAGSVPVAFEPADPVIDRELNVDGEVVRVTCCSMGNPHAAVFVNEQQAQSTMLRLGPRIERHPLFPNRTNVEFITVMSRRELRVRFWERGVGVTLSSGTGSASALVASVLTGRSEREVTVHCEGGDLIESWAENGPVLQRGPVEITFEGDWLVA